jgi:probable rRNA maturation factor
LAVHGREINFLLVSDPVSRGYNVRYLRHDYATDVIAFPSFDVGDVGARFPRAGGGTPPLLGDILISTDTAKRQAKEQGHSTLKETAILAVHGVLHLLGYRDKKKADRDRMWRETDRLMTLAGMER